ncbi:MAG: tryptophan 7-halogenase [Gammaproteobacteria bacterium]|nr:tryptophan 7-halogenase [Gammaproteobacteria bacterium]
MTANLMQHAWPEATISLIESSNIGIIGVGEGSTPALKQFFKKLKISESDWMPECNATYKVGISFPNWSTRPGFESYFHPFFSELDLKPGEPFFYNSKLQKDGVSANAHPDQYFVTAEMARRRCAPISEKYPQIDIDYGYHFDSGLLGEFLKTRAIANGLIHIIDDITSVVVDNEQIQSVIGKKHGTLIADLYVDCTGFSSLLLQKALGVPFKHYKENLFNDSAVAIATDIDIEQGIPAETRSSALSAGWAWRIPLVNRYGNGYVYSSDYISSEQAESELREHLQAFDEEKYPARHLKMKVGRVEQHWKSNCLGVGLSQGFIEPLEATALMLVQYTIEEFIQAQSSNNNEKYSEFNTKVNKMMEGIRDYIVCHYVTNSRDDSAYWRDCRNAKRSSNLDKLLSSWSNNESFEQALRELDNELVYLRPSWYVMLMGVGRFPEQLSHQAPTDKPVFDVKKAKGYCEQLVDDVFPSHNDYLKKLYQDKWA